MVIVPLLSKKYIMDVKQKAIEKQKGFISNFLDYMDGEVALALSRNEAKVYRRFERQEKEYFQVELDTVRVISRVETLNYMTTSILYLGIWIVGTYFIVNGSMKLPQIVAFTQLAVTIVVPLNSVLSVGGDYFSGKEIVNSIDKYLLEKDITDRDTHIVDFNNIIFKDITFKDDEKLILENINISFDFSKKYMLVGDSGSGKSTILNLIFDKYIDYSGEILFGNIEKRELNYDSIIENVGYFPQANHIFEDTIRNNITLFDSKYSDEEVLGVLDKVNLKDRDINELISDKSSNLSGGERQRLILARILIRNYKFIILDEPTSGLDNKSTRMIESLLSSLDIGFLLISHNYSSEMKFDVDELISIKSGKIQ